jgi:high-affinity nickel permease
MAILRIYFSIVMKAAKEQKIPKIVSTEVHNDKLARWVMIGGAVITLIGLYFIPMALTNKPSWWQTYGQNTGVIGDTIGGIAGPILNFTGLLLVYYSLREQFKANQQQMQQYEYDSTTQLLERFIALLDKHKEVFIKLPQLEFAHRLGLKTSVDENIEAPLGFTALRLRQSELRQIVSIFNLIMSRLPTLTDNQKKRYGTNP